MLFPLILFIKMPKGKTAENLLREIESMPHEQVKRDRPGIIQQIIHGSYSEREKINLRMELQKRLLEENKETLSGGIAGLEATDNALSVQCDISSVVTKKLIESDSKVLRIRGGQEKLAEEMNRVSATIQKRKKKEFREEILFIGSLGLFIVICVYVLLRRLFS